MVDRGSWVVDRGSWVVDRGSWVVDRGRKLGTPRSWGVATVLLPVDEKR
jgi:hypothetical protein